MIKPIKALLCFMLLFAALPVATTGCATPKERIAFNAVSATITGINIGMKEWWTYVVKEEDRIAALPALDRGTLAADLLRKEGRVMEAYGSYQSAIRSSGVAVRIAKSNGSPLPQDVQEAVIHVLTLIRDLQK